MKQALIIILLFFCWSSFTDTNLAKYPVPPKTKELLFYIQRNHNANTIVYNANYDKDGILIHENPIKVFWIRYAEQGQKMELRTIERKFAYGVACQKIKSEKNKYIVKLAAEDDKEFILVQKAPYKAVIMTNINGELSILDHLYIYADNSGFWPTVKYIEFFGTSIKKNQQIYQKKIIE